MKKLLLIIGLLIPISCLALDNSQYWQMQQNLNQQQIIREMQAMRREQERANSELQNQYWMQQRQLQQQNIWHPQPQFYPIRPIGQ